MRRRLSLGRLAIFVGGFFALWTIAWLVAIWANVVNSLPYWVVAKLLIFAGYPILFWQKRWTEQLEFIGAQSGNLRRGLKWGTMAALTWVVACAAAMVLSGQHLRPASVTLTQFYVIGFTPIVEEVLFRGYIQSSFVAIGWPWAPAIGVTSFLFIALHFLGWSFQGRLVSNLHSLNPVNIFLVSLLLGYVRHRSGSLAASMILHAANNAFSVLLVGN